MTDWSLFSRTSRLLSATLSASTAAACALSDQWVDWAETTLAPAARAWAAQGADAAAARRGCEAALSALDGALASRTFLCGDAPALGDAWVAAQAAPLFAGALGAAERAALPHTSRWFVATRAAGGSEAALHAGEGWAAPAAQVAGGAGGALSEADAKKAAKKAAKLAEKEAKKAKAAAKKAKGGFNAPGSKAKKRADKKGDAGATAEAPEEVQPETPSGECKRMSQAMAKTYDPKTVEHAWYQWWEKEGFFTADPESKKPKFVIVIPPPNVTGSLHLGHALTNSVQDTIVRWRRMCGYECLWVPGCDHAGIATQTVVEKQLKRTENKSRHDLGREAFLKKVWQWKEEYGGRICQQLRRIGSSLDWTREVFTMDQKLSRAVTESFVRMHAEGLIFRDNRLVNWSCQLKSAISDIEVDYIDLESRTMVAVPGYKEKVEFGGIWSFAYPFADGSGEIVVATTRPETMLGDTAVAVHPDDPRYKVLHGKTLKHPFVDREIPVICDAELVDMAFGTGAVKITPAHDPNDFETGKRHGLEFISILTDDGKINANGGARFAGTPRFEARRTVLAALEEAGLYRGVADNKMRLGLCSRSKDVIEPMIKPQWWVDCKGMAADACEVVRDGRLEIIPKMHEKTWFNWLENIRDWCISRQLWWGHRIPAYFVRLPGDDAETGQPGTSSEKMDRWVVGRAEADALADAKKRFPEHADALQLAQDEDVLDTWYSSGLFPFSVMGWPDQTADLDAFYPTSLLETGHDILFFWVARMVMQGMKLTGKVPFSQVYLHAMVRDAHGRKMSKSLGNVIDPLECIEGISLAALQKKLEAGNLDPREVKKAQAGQAQDYPDGIPECGTDALRFALTAYTSQGRDINLDVQRVVGYRQWCNKLWNAIRFATRNLAEGFKPPTKAETVAIVKGAPLAVRWVLARLTACAAAANKAMEVYDFSAATSAIYDFWQYKLCDVYIEAMKPLMAEGADEGDKRAARVALWLCLDSGLRLLHPFMPFVTEELWQRLPKAGSEMEGVRSIMLAPYPRAVPEWEDAAAEEAVAAVQAAAGAVRSLRAGYNLPNKVRPALLLHCKGDKVAALAKQGAAMVATLSLSDSCEVVTDGAAIPKGCGVAIVDESVTAHVVLVGHIDAAKEMASLTKKLEALAGQLETLEKKMVGADYASKVPEAVRKTEADKKRRLEGEREACQKAIGEFKGML